jgi:hypothetical protein
MHVKEKTQVVNLLNVILCQENYFHCTGLKLNALHSLGEQTHSKIEDRRKLSGKKKEYTDNKTNKDTNQYPWSCGLRRGSVVA